MPSLFMSRRPRAAVFTLALLTLAATLTGCGGGKNNPTGITITGPTSTTIDPGDSATFTAAVAGGPTGAGVSWSLVGCSTTSCGTLSSATTTGVTYTAPATVTTAFTVTVTAISTSDNNVTAGTAINVPVNPTITTPAGGLPNATFGSAYSVTLAGSGGISPYTWSITQGALPAGLSLTSGGTLSGTPSAAGTVTFTAQLADSGSPALTATAAYSITVLYPTISVTTTSLPNGVEGNSYNTQLMATGGNGNYVWSATGTALSAVGLSLSSAGAITGIPTTGETNAPLTVTVTDTVGHTASANLTLTVTAEAFQGQVIAGTTPVSGATIQLYAAGATGNSSAAIPMLTQAVTTDSIGMFQIKNLYTCGQSSTGASIPTTAQLYLVATGGIASSTSTASNAALTMVTAIGPCTNLTTTPQFTINERTTAAAAWALASFASSATNIGATSTNTLGLTNAFLDAALLANPATGANATLATGLSVEAGKLNALSDALNSCTSGDGTTCTTLFTAATPTAGTTPTDTFTAALNITHHPGENVAAVYAAIPTTPPFATSPLTQSPNDWTMSLTITNGGLFMPTALGIDSQNNIWVANQDSPLSAFNAQGTPLTPNGYGAGAIAQTYGLAIDTSNNVWVTNYNGGSGSGSVTEFNGINSPTLGASTSYSSGICYPYAVAADTNGDIFVANEECNTATILGPSGAVISANVGESLGLDAKPIFLAVDTSHGFWLPNGYSIAHISAPSTAYPNGQLLSNPTCCYDSLGLALDVAGNVWVANYQNSSISEVASDGTVLINQQTVANGAATPFATAVDAGQNIWFTNLYGSSILELAGPNATTPGTELSPSTGLYNHGGFGLDASLTDPYSLAPDRSGNLWVANNGQNSLTMFFGLATPTRTPLQPIPTAP